MYAQVVVLTYQSPEIDSYTYVIPKSLEGEIKIGQLVEVPFGKRNPMGVVLSLKSHPHESEDQILNPFDKQSFSSNKTQGKQVENDKIVLIKPISRIIISAPLLLPYQVELLKWMAVYCMAPLVNCLEVMLPLAALKAKRLKTNAEKFQNSVSHSSLDLRQSLVLVPTLNQIPQTLAKFPKAKNYALYHNELKASEKFETWLKILSGKTDYIFGSRSAIFTPTPNLGEIIIYDEHDGAYKDERSPYFDTLTVAQKISELTGAQIKIVDPAPKITTYFQLKNRIKMQKFSATSKIISMRQERLSGNYSPLSQLFQQEIKKRKGQNTLLFLNKIKESGSLFCKSCKYNDYFEKAPEFCPKCKSQDFYFNVLNIESLKKEAEKISQPSNIDVETASIFYAPIVKKYDLAAYIQPDSLLNRTDFSSSENFYSNTVNLKKLLKENGTLIIQTFNPDDQSIKAVQDNNFEHFYKDQLNSRRLLSYPPFALLVKITIKGKNRDKAKNSAHELFSDIQSKLSTIQQFNNLTIQLLGPFEPLFFSKLPTFNIIIKYKLQSYSLKEKEKAIKNIAPILKGVHKDFQITVEPESMN